VVADRSSLHALTAGCKVTVGIKALNEEARIASALASAVAAVEPLGGEVILADSGSRDRTIEIARAFPVTIVQLANPAERCCGAGAQLAFQQARGRYFYLLDGDMVLDPTFLARGIAYLESHPDVAGVGGRVIEMNLEGEGFRVRAAGQAKALHSRPGEVDRLDCGGLYRVDALRQVAWFADRNLHAFEEFELGARLRAMGWKLARIDCPAVQHYGHVMGGYRLLLRRIASGYSGAPGEVLRGALGQRHLPVVLRDLAHVRNGIAVMIWWVLLIAALFAPGSWWTLVALLIVPLAFLSLRHRSLRLGLYLLVAWNVTAFSLVPGFVRRRVPPDRPLEFVTLATGSIPPGGTAR
jgi:GT2 family glycosyltransferase